MALSAAIVHQKRDDLDAAAAALRPFAERDPRWREAFERNVRLRQMPQAVLDRLD